MSLALPKRLHGQSPSHARSRAQEKETAKRVGGRVTPGSGNGSVKGDVRLKGVVRVENKTTKNKSFSVTEDMIRKIEEATFGTDEIPVIHIEISSGAKTVVVMPDWALDLILGGLKG